MNKIRFPRKRLCSRHRDEHVKTERSITVLVNCYMSTLWSRLYMCVVYYKIPIVSLLVPNVSNDTIFTNSSTG